MEPVLRVEARSADAATEFAARPAPDSPRMLTVTATYLLSEEGRKASLLAGGDGRAQQQITIQVPATRLHLVTVDANGRAGLKLRPRYQLDGEQRVVRHDAWPTYERPPGIEELLRDAARNHELERAFVAERSAARMKRREADRDLRDRLAQAFLTDKTQRALVHPAPSTKRCYLTTDQGRILFDVGTDEGAAKNVPPEAHRRFRADLSARKERNRQMRAEQLALHEEKKRFIAEWIAQHGTPDQQQRHAAGVLPMDEAIEAMTDQAFAPLAAYSQYRRDGVERLQSFLRELPEYRDAVLSRDDLVVNGTNATMATAAQWRFLGELKALLPESTVMLREHTISWRRDTRVAIPSEFGVLVTQRVGPFTLRREYSGCGNLE